MGNRHDMKSKSMAERDRVVTTHAIDLEADIKRKGSMHQAMMAITFDIVDRGDKVVLLCFDFASKRGGITIQR
jgi:hypothetical protein